MVPPFIDPSVVASERRVFEALRIAPGTDDWLVLHSLGFSSQWAGEFGEIDFVVVIPGSGIVCVEVKGGGVSVREGVWTTRDRFGKVEILKRSPFRQAQEGMWKLRTALEKRFRVGSSEARCPLGWLVIFPDVACPPLTPEAAREEIVDRDDMDENIGLRVAHAPSLVRLHERSDLLRPNVGTCSRIVGFLRPGFERVPAPASRDWDAEERIRALTEEQFEALDSIADNPICLICGPAGTGKTLLGLESVRRTAVAGRDAVVLCFNQNLGRWLTNAVAGQGPGRVVAGNLHARLRERIVKSSFATEFVEAERTANRDDLFGRIYYELGALAIEECGERFDLIVVDEVQDMPSSYLGEVVKAWSRPNGETRIVLLGDFTRQALFTGSANASVPLLGNTLGPMAVFKLRLNCRNTRRIALQTATLSGFGDLRLSDRQPEGDQVSVQFYDDQEVGIVQFDRVIRAIRETGQKAHDVVVLGPRRKEHTILANVTSAGGWRLCDLSSAGLGELAYSTIYAFKGLERPVVILVDMEWTSPEESDALLYVAMTRARLRLFILAPASVRPAIEQRMASAALAAIGVKHP